MIEYPDTAASAKRLSSSSSVSLKKKTQIVIQDAYFLLRYGYKSGIKDIIVAVNEMIEDVTI